MRPWFRRSQLAIDGSLPGVHGIRLVEEPLSVSIYPGTDASFLLYEDDGSSFNYRKGEWMGMQMAWDDARRILSLNLAPGSRLLPPESRAIAIKVAGTTRSLTFEGKPVQVSF